MVGCVGSGIFNLGKGFLRSPKQHRISGALNAMIYRAPLTGGKHNNIKIGSFAVWGFLYSSFDCTFAFIRKKEDYINSVAAGATTGGVLAIRGINYFIKEE